MSEHLSDSTHVGDYAAQYQPTLSTDTRKETKPLFRRDEYAKPQLSNDGQGREATIYQPTLSTDTRRETESPLGEMDMPNLTEEERLRYTSHHSGESNSPASLGYLCPQREESCTVRETKKHSPICLIVRMEKTTGFCPK